MAHKDNATLSRSRFSLKTAFGGVAPNLLGIALSEGGSEDEAVIPESVTMSGLICPGG